MSGNLFLTAEEMVELSGKRKHHSQAKVLRAMGVEHVIRPDGRVLVLRQHVEQLFGAKAEADRDSDADSLIHWNAA
ncbi:DUF4224 domain-containing protein [Burkholderia sp. M6-3]